MLLRRICFFHPISIYFQEKMALSNNCPSDFLRKKNNFHNFFGIARHVYLLILHCSRDFEKLWWINKGGHICPPHLWIAVQNCPLCKKNKTLKKQEFAGLSGPLVPLICAQLSPVFICEITIWGGHWGDFCACPELPPPFLIVGQFWTV